MILIDPPRVPRWDRLWSHLASDCSVDELHTFAHTQGIARHNFDRDHYDVSADHYRRMVEAGAVEVSSRELVIRLRKAGLRRPKPLDRG